MLPSSYSYGSSNGTIYHRKFLHSHWDFSSCLIFDPKKNAITFFHRSPQIGRKLKFPKRMQSLSSIRVYKLGENSGTQYWILQEYRNLATITFFISHALNPVSYFSSESCKLSGALQGCPKRTIRALSVTLKICLRELQGCPTPVALSSGNAQFFLYFVFPGGVVRGKEF